MNAAPQRSGSCETDAEMRNTIGTSGFRRLTTDLRCSVNKIPNAKYHRYVGISVSCERLSVFRERDTEMRIPINALDFRCPASRLSVFYRNANPHKRLGFSVSCERLSVFRERDTEMRIPIRALDFRCFATFGI